MSIPIICACCAPHLRRPMATRCRCCGRPWRWYLSQWTGRKSRWPLTSPRWWSRSPRPCGHSSTPPAREGRGKDDKDRCVRSNVLYGLVLQESTVAELVSEWARCSLKKWNLNLLKFQPFPRGNVLCAAETKTLKKKPKKQIQSR